MIDSVYPIVQIRCTEGQYLSNIEADADTVLEYAAWSKERGIAPQLSYLWERTAVGEWFCFIEVPEPFAIEFTLRWL